MAKRGRKRWKRQADLRNVRIVVLVSRAEQDQLKRRAAEGEYSGVADMLRRLAGVG